MDVEVRDICQGGVGPKGPKVDLFAARDNAQLPKHVAWRPDPWTWRMDVLSLVWTNMSMYAYPPFGLLMRVVRKVQTDRTTGILIALLWPTQLWYLVLMNMLYQYPTVLPRNRAVSYTHLTLPTKA